MFYLFLNLAGGGEVHVPLPRMGKGFFLLAAITVASVDAFSPPHVRLRSKVVMRGGLGVEEETRDPAPTPEAIRAQGKLYSEAIEFVAKSTVVEESPVKLSAPASPAVTVSPAQAVVIGGGALGILGAAFCTSTGSPPNGLTVAFVAIGFMATGASIIEATGKA